LLADNCWNADGYFVWNTYWNSLANLDCLLLAYWNANCIRNLLAYVFAAVAANGVCLCLALWNHGASCVANVLSTLFANHVANFVAYGLGVALWNHLAGCVSAGLAAWLANHFASCAVNSLASAFWNHAASCVGASLAAWFANCVANFVANSLAVAFWNHLASSVLYSLCTAFWNHLANGVRNALSYTALFVTNAIDGLGFAGWNPNLLANRLWWALYTLYMASAWAVCALACARIIRPCAWLTYSLANNWTSNFFGNRRPASAVDSDFLGVVNWSCDCLHNVTCALFLNWNHDRVVDYMLMCFMNWLHNGVVNNFFAVFPHLSLNRVVDDLFMGLVYRGHDGVVNNLRVCFVDWSANCVVDDLFMGLVHRLHDSVVNFSCASLIHRTAYVVRNRLGVSLMNWSHYRVVTSLGLVVRCANRLVDSAITCLGYHPSYVDHFVFCHRLIFGACTLFGTLFVNRFAYSLHDCVSCSYFAAAFSTAATVVVADSAAISSVGYATGHCS
jgi:hypothetical protein